MKFTSLERIYTSDIILGSGVLLYLILGKTQNCFSFSALQMRRRGLREAKWPVRVLIAGE